MTKPKKLIYEIVVNDNGIYDPPRSLNRDVAVSFAGKTTEWVIQERQRRLSPNQRGYYRGVIIPEATEQLQNAGWQLNEKEVHGYMARTFLTTQKHMDNGVIEYVRSTTDLFVFEMSLYMDAVIQWVAENLGYPISPPRNQTKYIQPEMQLELESREKYLTRIKKYLSEIEDFKMLKRYFEYWPEWKSQDDVRNLFNERKDELKKV